MRIFPKRNFVYLIWCTLLASFVAGCTPGRMLLYNFSDIRDHKKFPKREIEKGEETFRFSKPTDAQVAAFDQTIRTPDFKNRTLDDFLPETKTVAFLVIRNDTMLYEKYFRRKDSASIIPSFSVAKSFTSALVGLAIEDGRIASVEDSMTQYLTELQGRGLHKIKIKHLLKMTSGIKSQENYFTPFAGVARMYYGRDLRRQMSKVKPETRQGLAFEYRSINTQLLGMIVDRVIDTTLTAYLEEKLWKPMGMESDASWSVDRRGEKGIEKAFCCLNATARDFAKFGRLYLNGGNWNGKQLISNEWVEESTKLDAKDGSSIYYQYQWWIVNREGDYAAQGHLGQYIFVNPAKNIVIVRLGKNSKHAKWMQLMREIASKN